MQRVGDLQQQHRIFLWLQMANPGDPVPIAAAGGKAVEVDAVEDDRVWGQVIGNRRMVCQQNG